MSIGRSCFVWLAVGLGNLRKSGWCSMDVQEQPDGTWRVVLPSGRFASPPGTKEQAETKLNGLRREREKLASMGKARLAIPPPNLSVATQSAGADTRASLGNTRTNAAAQSSDGHYWMFIKMHYDWQQFACWRCGCMKVNKPDGSVIYKPWSRVRLNPFARPLSKPPDCVRNPKSTCPF